MYYLAMDGGGTKLLAILFDDRYNLIATARSEGTHLSVYPIETVRRHVADCYADLFQGLPRPLHIECLYTICGDSKMFGALLPDGITLGDTHNISEPISGLYAGTAQKTGFVALSGTGSDVFCIKNSQLLDVIGGWGAILGDEGSGVWMAREAMNAAIRAEQGWGPPTRFGEMVKETYHLTDLWDYVAYLYATPSPFRRLGELLPLVARAAGEGDDLMTEILRRGGRVMAEQMTALLRRHPDMEPNITACGGAWKAHPAMAETFYHAVKQDFPHAVFTLPRFEHVMAGPICRAMENGEDMQALTDLLAKRFPTLVWNTPKEKTEYEHH